MTPSCGDSWPRGHLIRSARGSTVVRGSCRATLSLTDRERYRSGYVFHALSRLLEERDRVWRGGGPMGLMVLSDRSPTPPCPARVEDPATPLAPIMDTYSSTQGGNSEEAKGHKGYHHTYSSKSMSRDQTHHRKIVSPCSAQTSLYARIPRLGPGQRGAAVVVPS